MTAPTAKPTHDLVLITPGQREGDRDRFTTICPVWLNQKGDGWTLDIPAGLTITGRCIIQARRDRQAQGE